MYAACVKSSKRAVGDRQMCVCEHVRVRARVRVSKRRKGRSDEAKQGGRGTRDGETGGRDREKKRGRTKDGSADGKMLAGAQWFW